MTSLDRIARALRRDGVEIEMDGSIYRIRRAGHEGPFAEVLLPKGFPLETKAVVQLAAFASARHPNGGHVCHACATPDFHPGNGVPVGSVVATSLDLAIPSAIGTDINCGMRMHATGLSVDRFLAEKRRLVDVLRGDLLLGTRDLPMTGVSMRAMFDGGEPDWLDAVLDRPLGMLARSDLGQIGREIGNGYRGRWSWAPEGLVDDGREIVRDGALGTVGGGNHFVEFQVVDDVADGGLARAWGLKNGEVVFMVHTGSRTVGKAVGTRWSEIAREHWPSTVRRPDVLPLYGADVDGYVEAMNTAANYGAVNRLLIAEIVRLRLREIHGDIGVTLVHDAPHNLVFREGDMLVHRKGATPAHAGQPVLIPGSMGQPSYVLVGRGNGRYLSSASHGAGRAVTRFEMGRRQRAGDDLGLDGVDCVTLREERRIEEAPSAYKDIGPVVSVQVEHGLVAPVVRTRPLVTFKA